MLIFYARHLPQMGIRRAPLHNEETNSNSYNNIMFTYHLLTPYSIVKELNVSYAKL